MTVTRAKVGKLIEKLWRRYLALGIVTSMKVGVSVGFSLDPNWMDEFWRRMKVLEILAPNFSKARAQWFAGTPGMLAMAECLQIAAKERHGGVEGILLTNEIAVAQAELAKWEAGTLEFEQATRRLRQLRGINPHNLSPKGVAKRLAQQDRLLEAGGWKLSEIELVRELTKHDMPPSERFERTKRAWARKRRAKNHATEPSRT